MNSGGEVRKFYTDKIKHYQPAERIKAYIDVKKAQKQFRFPPKKHMYFDLHLTYFVSALFTLSIVGVGFYWPPWINHAWHSF